MDSDLEMIEVQEINPTVNLAKVGTKKEISREELDQYVELIKMVAATIVRGSSLPQGIDFDDLMGYGWEGLHKAWKVYSGDKGASFRTYASYRIRGEILDRMRVEWRYRNPKAFSRRERIQERVTQVAIDSIEAFDEVDKFQPTEVVKDEQRMAQVISNSAVVYMLSLDNIGKVPTLYDVPDVSDIVHGDIDKRNEYHILSTEIEDLDAQEQQFIQLFYRESKSQKEIAALLNISKSKASRVHIKLLEKLKRRLKKRIVGDNDL